VGERVACPHAQVAVQGKGGLAAEGTARGRRPLPSTMTTWSSRSRSPGSMIPGRLGDPHPGVEKQPENGRVPPVSEVPAPTGLQQPAQLIVGQHRRRLVRDLRRVHAGHRASVQLALGHRPLEERPEAPVAVQRRERLPALQLVGDNGPHVVTSDPVDRERVAALGQEVGEQPDASVYLFSVRSLLSSARRVRRKLPMGSGVPLAGLESASCCLGETANIPLSPFQLGLGRSAWAEIPPSAV
jgi:hypothetical protein